jgi:predicted ATPase/class 3 adenylate cyclase
MTDLPTGTVTFLFTDIEGSTKLLHELGAHSYAEALAEHRRALRESFARNGGVEVDTQGDAFFVAFPTAAGALAAAQEAQQALAAQPLSVRMGAHTGEPTVTREGYVGIDVHRGARIAAAGHGGQVLVSQTTRELVNGEFPLVDLGDHRLKDLSAPQRLWQLGAGEFPALKTLHGTNLPVQATALVGRERELAEAAQLLRDHRLVTLLGPGGSGKTRLALQVAAEAIEEFPDGVWWVSLAAVADAELVLPTVAQMLGAAGELVTHLRTRRQLLLLDNLEQVIECAPELAELLASTTELRLLVTTREPLRIAGEREYAVEPLAEQAAVSLFVERAVHAEPREAVAAICRRLDCLPLAVELAAARTKLLAPDELFARLDQSLALLTSGRRDAPARQRTLRATIEWSHELLSPEEQELFRRLAVFAGSFTLGAAEAVTGGDLDTVQSLIEKSLVRRWGSGRLGMLETMREFALERLEQSGEAEAFRRRHLEHLVELGEAANMYLEAEGNWRPELILPERDNARTALEWALDRGELELGVRLAVSLEQVWVSVDPFEGARWLSRCVERASELSPAQRARALRVLGGVTYIVGRFDEGVRLGEQSLDLYRELGDEQGIALMLPRAAIEAHRVGDLERAQTLAEESLALNRRRGSRYGEAESLRPLADIAWSRGEHDRALELLEECAGSARAIGWVWWEASALLTRAEYAVELGRYEDATEHASEGLRLARCRTGSTRSGPSRFWRRLRRRRAGRTAPDCCGARSRPRKREGRSDSGKSRARRSLVACSPIGGPISNAAARPAGRLPPTRRRPRRSPTRARCSAAPACRP